MKDKARFQIGLYPFDRPICKLIQDGVPPCTDGNHIFFCDNDAERRGGIGHIVAGRFRHRHIDDDQRAVIFGINMRRFLFVHCGTEEVRFNLEIFNQAANLRIGRGNAVDPATRFACLQLSSRTALRSSPLFSFSM